jgi:four helix bundle protein
MAGQNYRDLIAWQKAMDLAESVYRVTANMPREELYGLTAQIRRACISVPANIAEGRGRRTHGEFLNQLSISHGSVREVETHALLAGRLRFLTSDDVNALMELTAEVGRLINGLANSLQARKPQR